MLSEKARSRAQQKLFGIVRSYQKGELENPSPEVEKIASTVSKSDVKKMASTKHTGLPEKKKIEEVAFLAAAGKVALAAGKGAVKQKAKQVIAQKAANVAKGSIPQPNRDQQQEGVGRAAIGAGVGALVGGPVGAAAGAAIGASLGKKKVTSGGNKVKKKATNFFKAEPKVTSSEGVVSFVKKGLERDKKAKKEKDIKNRKAVPYAALAAETQPEGELVDEEKRPFPHEKVARKQASLRDKMRSKAYGGKRSDEKNRSFKIGSIEDAVKRGEDPRKDTQGGAYAKRGNPDHDHRADYSDNRRKRTVKPAGVKKEEVVNELTNTTLLGYTQKATNQLAFKGDGSKKAQKRATGVKKATARLAIRASDPDGSMGYNKNPKNEEKIVDKMLAKYLPESRLDKDPPPQFEKGDDDRGNPDYMKSVSYADEEKWKRLQKMRKASKKKSVRDKVDEEVGISSSAAMEKAQKEAKLKAKEDAAVAKKKKVTEAKVDAGKDDEAKEDARNTRKFGHVPYNKHGHSVLRRAMHRSDRKVKKIRGNKEVNVETGKVGKEIGEAKKFSELSTQRKPGEKKKLKKKREGYIFDKAQPPSKKVTSEGKETAKLAANILRDKEPCAECGSLSLIHI